MRNRRWAGDGRRHAATGARDGNHAHAGDGLGRGDVPRDACRASGVACAMVCRVRAVARRRRQDGSGVKYTSKVCAGIGHRMTERSIKIQCNQQRNLLGPSRAPHAATLHDARPPPTPAGARPRASA